MVMLLLSIIAAHLCSIWCILRVSITPRQEDALASGNRDLEPKENSIVGASRSVRLYAPPPKPTPKPASQMGDDELDEAFIHTEFSAEYSEQQTQEEQPQEEQAKEEQAEVITTDYQGGDIVDEHIQQRICVDYEQISSSVRKVARGDTLDIEDSETLQMLEGTDIDAKLKELVPAYQTMSAERLAKY